MDNFLFQETGTFLAHQYHLSQLKKVANYYKQTGETPSGFTDPLINPTFREYEKNCELIWKKQLSKDVVAGFYTLIDEENIKTFQFGGIELINEFLSEYGFTQTEIDAIPKNVKEVKVLETINFDGHEWIKFRNKFYKTFQGKDGKEYLFQINDMKHNFMKKFRMFINIVKPKAGNMKFEDYKNNLALLEDENLFTNITIIFKDALTEDNLKKPLREQFEKQFINISNFSDDTLRDILISFISCYVEALQKEKG